MVFRFRVGHEALDLVSHETCFSKNKLFHFIAWRTRVYETLLQRIVHGIVAALANIQREVSHGFGARFVCLQGLPTSRVHF